VSNLAKLQQEFLALLQGHNQHFTARVKEQAPVATETRLAIYQNAYHMRLRETIDNDHPMLGVFLGDQLYDLLVKSYIEQFPSSVKSLRHFCHSLPVFLSENAPFVDHPVLSELASFERMLLDVFDAKDQNTCTISDLQQVVPERWPLITFRFHPSVRLYDQHHQAVEIWQALKAKKTPTSPTKTNETVFWLMWRSPQRLTEFRHLSVAERKSFECFKDGGNFADVCQLLSEFYQPQDVPVQALGFIQVWLSSGLISVLSTECH